MHGMKKKESLPQGIIKPLGDDDDDGRFSLDEAIDMVSALPCWRRNDRISIFPLMRYKLLTLFHRILQRKSSEFISHSAHSNEDEPWHLNNKSGRNQ